MATKSALLVDFLDLSIDDIECIGKVPSLIGQQQSTARDGSDSGLDTASLSNTSYELLRGISSNSADYEHANVPTEDLLKLTPSPKKPTNSKNSLNQHFEKMNISSTPTPNSTPNSSTSKNSKNLQRAASLSRTQRSSEPQISKSRNLQRTPSLARTRQLSTTTTTTTRSQGLVATLPRSCRQKSVDDLSSQNSRSSSVARETNSRMYNSMLTRKNLMTTSSYAANPASSSGSGNVKRRPSIRTTIYHETSTQTALTQSCLERLMAGKELSRASLTLGTHELSCEQYTQTYIRDQELEQAQQTEQLLGDALQAERKQRYTLEQQLLKQSQRLMSLGSKALALHASLGVDVGGKQNVVEDVNAALLLLEGLISLSGCELKEREEECTQMRLYCRTLQQSLKQCLDAQQSMIKENEEQLELNEFMQNEKSSLEMQLRHVEADSQAQLEERNNEIRILRGECCHLVRLNEQRRQENSLMQTRYKALETRQKNIVSEHNTVVIQAMNAVAELYTRLDNLLQHLITAYNIGEIEQWDELVNEEQSNNSLVDAEKQITSISTNKCTLRGGLMMSTQNQHYLLVPHATAITNKEDLSPECNRSFIAAIIEAIRNATTPARKRSNSNSKDVSSHHHHQQQQQQQQQQSNDSIGIVSNKFVGFNNALEDESDSTEMLDSETEPCLMMDNVLEDVTLPDSHSHNMVSSIQQQQQQQDESLHNLSQAIVNRQQAELQVLRNVSLDASDGTSMLESFGDASILTEETPLKAVVERVVELDSLVTKLLKALHLVQTENNNVIQQLILDKNELQQNKEELLEEKEHYKQEYENVVCQLREKERDLSKAKADVQRQRNDIDRLTEDICNLSTLCHKYKQLSPTITNLPNLNDQEATREEDTSAQILQLLNMWQKQGYLRNIAVQRFVSSIVSTELETVSIQLNVYKKHLQNVLLTLNNVECLNEKQNMLEKLQNDTAVLLQNVEVMSAMDVNANSNETQNDEIKHNTFIKN